MAIGFPTHWFKRNFRGLLLLATLALVIWAAWFFFLPARLEIAVDGRDGATETTLISVYADALSDQKKDVRLTLERYHGYRETGQALEERKVDLAVVRSDIFHPANGLTAAILREEALLIVTPKNKKIDSFDKLTDRRLGMIVREEADAILLGHILDHYRTSVRNVNVVRIDPREVDGSLAQRIDALAFLATPRSEEALTMIQTATRVFGDNLDTIPLEGLEPLTHRNPAIKEATIAPGTFGLRPKLPDEEIKTASVAVRLVAADTVDRVTLSKVVQYLFEMRPRLARNAVTANQMKAPENDAAIGAALPNHRGATDYFNREQQGFMDRYGDFLWLGLFGIGGMTSIFAWLGQLVARRRREVVDQVLDRLICILAEARAATTQEQLTALSEEIDHLVVHTVRNSRRRTSTSPLMATMMIAIDAARAAVADRRAQLAGGAIALVPDRAPPPAVAAAAE